MDHRPQTTSQTRTCAHTHTRRAQFTTNEAGLSGVAHVADAPPGGAKDYGALVAAALEMGGFSDDNMPELDEGHPGHFTVGFGHQVGGTGCPGKAPRVALKPHPQLQPPDPMTTSLPLD